MELSGFRAAVTGAANGIGRAIALELLRGGAQVFVCDIDSENGEAMAREYGISFCFVDVRDAQALKDWFASVGGVDILINNVGVSEFCPLEELETEDFDRVISINLRPTFILSREFALQYKNNKQKEYGRIINISSTRHLQSEPSSEAYAASKGGIASLTHALALSLSRMGCKNTTVNCISPGWIDTSGGEFSNQDHAQHPSGRIGKVGDIARMVRHLCHSENGFINAQDIVIDGGMTRKMIYVE